jgi:adenylyltransferase/sulfurtransferase
MLEANNVGEALDTLTTNYAELRKHLFTDQNALRSFVNVYVNDEDIRHGQALGTAVSDGDTVMIVPSIAGGKFGFRDSPLKVCPEPVVSF